MIVLLWIVGVAAAILLLAFALHVVRANEPRSLKRHGSNRELLAWCGDCAQNVFATCPHCLRIVFDANESEMKRKRGDA